MEIRKAQLMKQYLRCKNLIENEQNIRYFHTIASYNMKPNMISRVKIVTVALSEVEEIMKVIR